MKNSLQNASLLLRAFRLFVGAFKCIACSTVSQTHRTSPTHFDTQTQSATEFNDTAAQSNVIVPSSNWQVVSASGLYKYGLAMHPTYRSAHPTRCGSLNCTNVYKQIVITPPITAIFAWFDCCGFCCASFVWNRQFVVWPLELEHDACENRFACRVDKSKDDNNEYGYVIRGGVFGGIGLELWSIKCGYI